MFIQCKENKLLNKELSIDNSKSILNKKIVSNNKLIIFNYSKPTYILFNIIFIMLSLMTLIKMSYAHQEKEFNVGGLLLILINGFMMMAICREFSANYKIHHLVHGLFFYLTLVMLILSYKKKYSIDKRNLFSIILFCSILGFNLFVISNNAYLLVTSEQFLKRDSIREMKNDSKISWYMTFLNIFP